MKRKATLTVLTCLILTSLILASCSTSTLTATQTQGTTPTTTVMPTAAATTSTSAATTTPITTRTTMTTTTGNWWDSLGTPQYGGTLVLRSIKDIQTFDPYWTLGGVSVMAAWLEKLFGDDWTLNPSIFDYRVDFRPPDYVKGQLAESWEFADPGNFIVHLRKGVHWQDIPPANGREFIANDVVYHWDRLFGLDSGMKPSPYYTGNAVYQNVKSVTATDNYTVVFAFKNPNPENILETLMATGQELDIGSPEAVKQWGDLNDWHHAIGTGPFILQDFVSGGSAMLVKNPNYWGYDERYPQNQLPYVDAIKFLIIPDNATALAAMRTGKLDFNAQTSLQDAQSMQKTNPEILQMTTPQSTASAVVPRMDKAPFTDIRVREAMQMAIDLPTIAKTYYAGTADPIPSTLSSKYLKGWGYPYEEWPQELKDQYAYNPTAAKQLLAAAGYTDVIHTNVVADTSADLNLLQIVKSYLSQVGIDMEIRPLDSTSWNLFVKTGHKQDQLAYASSGSPLGIGYQPFMQLSRLQTGNGGNWGMVSDPVIDAFYPKAMAATSVDGVKQVFRDLNEYVARLHIAVSLLQPNQFALYQPWLKGYNGQTFSIWGPSSGALLLSLYGSRFWIDQNLKKSMGH